MSTLTLVSHKLLYIQVDGMVIGLNAEDRFVQRNLSSGVFTFNVKYANFHYFSIITIEPLQPGIEPFTKRRLCSAITFNTCRF